MRSHSPSVTAIVPTYNQASALKLCISALANQSLAKGDYEIIVVDDCSSDITPDLLEGWKSQIPNFFYIRHSRNHGRASSRNAGIDLARGAVVVFIDGDLVVDRFYLETHWRTHLQAVPDRLAVIGNIQYAPECIEQSNFGSFINSRYLGMRTARERQRIDLNDLPPIYFGGGITSVKRKEVITVGKFDSSIKSYGGEDIDLGFRLHQHGLRIVFSAQARVLHYDRVSFQHAKHKAVEAGRESIPRILEKYPQIFDWSWYRYLMPVLPGVDPPPVRLRKRILGCLLHPLPVGVVERLLYPLDRIPLFACPLAFRYLLAGWTRIGINSRQTSAQNAKQDACNMSSQ